MNYYIIELTDGFYYEKRFVLYENAEKMALSLMALRIWYCGSECLDYRNKRNKKRSYKMNHQTEYVTKFI